MHFSLLQDRLIAHLRSRVHGGQLTERSAARLIGVSQPHLHNVLKGARLLSTDMADQVLRSLNLCVFDLLEPDELRDWERAGGRRGAIPLLTGSLGPGRPFPAAGDSLGRFPFSLPGDEAAGDPAAAVLGEDPLMEPLFRGGDTALLDRAPGACRNVRMGSVYAIEYGGEGLVPRLESREGGVALMALRESAAGLRGFISLQNRNILEIVKAKVVWIGRNLESSFDCTEND